MMEQSKKIAVIGGGTGVHTVLSGLKRFPPHEVELSAIVTVADSGGSTGQLRDEFGRLPVGDFRMALAALAEESGRTNLLRDLFLYRFDKGEGLKGHNFGNLFLTAMSEMTGSTERAIEEASRVLRVRGKVIPVSADDVTLVAEYEDGSELRGETHIDEPPEEHDGTKRITRLSLEPEGAITDAAKHAILSADIIVLGPGDLYTSTLANIIVSGAAEALQQTSAVLIYITNLMTKYGQTYGFFASDHAAEITRYVGRKPDYILHNTAELPADILDTYKKEHDFPIQDDLSEADAKKAIMRADFLAEERIEKPSGLPAASSTAQAGDVLKRSLIRHDFDKLAQTIMNLPE